MVKVWPKYEEAHKTWTEWVTNTPDTKLRELCVRLDLRHVAHPNPSQSPSLRPSPLFRICFLPGPCRHCTTSVARQDLARPPSLHPVVTPLFLRRHSTFRVLVKMNQTITAFSCKSHSHTCNTNTYETTLQFQSFTPRIRFSFRFSTCTPKWNNRPMKSYLLWFGAMRFSGQLPMTVGIFLYMAAHDDFPKDDYFFMPIMYGFW